MIDTLASKVEQLEMKQERALNLLGEMVATLRLEPNQEHFPPKLIELAKIWERRFRKLTGSARHPDGLQDDPHWI